MAKLQREKHVMGDHANRPYEVKLTIDSGDPVSPRALAAAERALHEKRYLRDAFVTPMQLCGITVDVEVHTASTTDIANLVPDSVESTITASNVEITHIEAQLALQRAGVEACLVLQALNSDTDAVRVLLVGGAILALIVELLNSAIEAVVDRVGLEHHPLSGQAKDTGSAAVMLNHVLWVFGWAQVLLFG